MKINKNIKKLLKKNNSIKGFSLLELLITLAIIGILMVTVTNIITVNLKVSRMVMARTYVREETGIMLRIMKKDIRNSESVGVNSYGELEFVIKDKDRYGRIGDFLYLWAYNTNTMTINRGVFSAPAGHGFVSPVTYAVPADIEIGELTFEEFSSTTDNAIIRITLKARTDGMPDDAWITKVVAVSTRNYTSV